MASSTETASKQYPKRLGTSGIRGQLYETKLLSLIYFRAIHDKNIEEIYLATNVDKVGSFDDICFRVTFKDTNKPIAVFIQAKHRENNNSVLTLNKSDLAEYFNSSTVIKHKFKPNNEDVLFNGALDQTECLFVIYTTAKGDKKTQLYKGSLADRLNGLIRTGAPGSQPLHDEENVKLLCEIIIEEQMKALARQMAKCVYGEFNDIHMLMKDEHVIRYHAILAQKVFNVSEIQPDGHRDASFREDFFYIDEEFLRQFKDELCTEILKRRNRDNPTRYSSLLNSLMLLSKFTDPETLYNEVGSRFIYRNGKFVFLDENTPEHYKLFLEKINESQESIRRTVEIAVKECINQLSQSQSTSGLLSSFLLRLLPQTPGLKTSFVPSLRPLTTGLISNFLNRLLSSSQLKNFTSFKFKVPASFGNVDLTIRGSDEKIERKLNDLTSKIIRFIEKSSPSNIVTIDNSMGEGFLQLSGGIASAVGNLFIFDDSTKLLKFNDNYESLGNLAKKLYCKLKEKIVNFNEYKFDVKAQVFPKLTFATDAHTEKVASDFLSTLIFYTSQCNEKKVEETLIYEINNNQGDDVEHVEVTSDAIFLKYHDAIQKWSMSSKSGMGTYLEKEGSLYKNAVILSTNQPLISVMNMMQKIKNKGYTFSAEAVNSIKFDGLASGTVIVTENRALTVAKLTKQVNNRNTVVLDFEYIVNLSARDDKALRTELMHSKEVKTLIVIFDSALIATSSNSKLVNIASSMKDKRVIIVTDQKSVENAKDIFSATSKVIKDDRNRLIDLTKESQQSILMNTKVIFQGYEVSLGQILLNNSISYVTSDVLYKMMHSNQNVIGKPVINSNYKPNLYIRRSVRQYSRDKFKTETTPIRRREMLGFEEKLPGYVKGDRMYLRTLHDLLDAHDNNILIVGDPGMGKSTLLTHLTLNTKEIWSKTGWIVRVNLLEHTLQFSKWKDKKTDIDASQCFKFLCRAALSEESSKRFDHIKITLEESNGTVNLKDFTGDEWTLFELKMFLNFYNSNETLIVLFDGFDEICPTYANEVLSLINAVKTFSRNHKMWITSRSYNRMNTILELQFDTLFEIEPLEELQQHVYLTSLWDELMILKDLTEEQLKNIDEFISFISKNNHHMMILFKKIDLSPKARFEIQSRIDMPFILVCWSFMKYLKANLTFASSSIINALDKLFEMYFESGIFEMEFVASPLHLNIIGNYFYHKIKEINLEPNKWNWINEYFDMYKYYLETKLKKIRYQDKTQNDMTKPDNILAYKRDYADFMDKHKKLAAYAVYDKRLFGEDEVEQFKALMHEVKEGEERTGIICNVVNDVPIFVHSTLKEYFAVEYICDLLKSKDDQNVLWDYILNEMFFNCNNNVLTTLNQRIFLDEELDKSLKRNHKLIFDLLLQQGKNKRNVNGEVQSALCEVIRHDLRYLVNIFFTSIIEVNLNNDNLMDFIKIVNETNMLMLALKMDGFIEIWTIVSVVKKIDKTKLSMLFENLGLKFKNTNVNIVNFGEVYQKLQEHVWTRMEIVPDWKNISELSGQIYFI